MGFLFKYLKDYRKTLIGVLLLATINQVFSLLDPQIMRLIVDRYATRVNELAKGEFVSGVGWLLLAFVFVAFVSRVAKNFQDYYVNVITNKLGTKLYARSVEHALALPYVMFEDESSGAILQRMQKARNDIQILITSMINVLFVYLLGISFVIAYAFWVHWLVGLTIVLIVPFLAGAIFVISRRIKKVQKIIVGQQAALAGYTTETLRNVELVKSLGLEGQEIERLNKTNNNILQLELQRVKLVRTLSFIQGTLLNGLRALVMFIMLWLVFHQEMTLGQFFTMLFYSFFLFNPLAELSNISEQYQESRASYEALEKILNTPAEPKPLHPVLIDTVKSLTFSKVGFNYKDSFQPALYDINLEIKAGQTIAFVGPSGSGKTTLIKLLLVLYRPTQGKLLVNEKTDINDIDFENFRKKIGLVSQETQLFSGTIKDNLLFVNPLASDSDCRRVLDAAAGTNIIERGEAGLDTKIGEGGLKLSGGERQRLAIARALLRDPEILIFDEATSSLDSLTEKEITKTIQAIEKDRPKMMTIMIAHRLSTIAHVKNIYVLEKGRIIESGTHPTLIAKGGLYAALWRQQIASDF